MIESEHVRAIIIFHGNESSKLNSHSIPYQLPSVEPYHDELKDLIDLFLETSYIEQIDFLLRNPDRVWSVPSNNLMTHMALSPRDTPSEEFLTVCIIVDKYPDCENQYWNSISIEIRDALNTFLSKSTSQSGLQSGSSNSFWRYYQANLLGALFIHLPPHPAWKNYIFYDIHLRRSG